MGFAETKCLDKWVPDREHKKKKDEREDGRRKNGNAAHLGKYVREPDQLARRFRLAIRDLMTTEEIQELLKERIIGELKGSKRVKIMPTVLKIAAGQSFNSGGPKTDLGGNTWNAPSIHVHLNAMSDPQLKAYYERGEVPRDMRQLIDMRRASESNDPEGD